MACDLKVPKTPGAQAGKHACGRSGLIKGGGHLASCGSLLYIKPTAGHVTWGDQASHARPNGHSNFSRSRRPHHITPAGRGETQPKKTLTIASQAKGTAFSVKPSGIFRKSPQPFFHLPYHPLFAIAVERAQCLGAWSSVSRMRCRAIWGRWVEHFESSPIPYFLASPSE